MVGLSPLRRLRPAVDFLDVASQRRGDVLLRSRSAGDEPCDAVFQRRLSIGGGIGGCIFLAHIFVVFSWAHDCALLKCLRQQELRKMAQLGAPLAQHDSMLI